jgi:hypothetical protein
MKTPKRTHAAPLLKDLGDAISSSAETRAAYIGAVELVAEILRPRFESGELRGFTDDDCERCGKDRSSWTPPLWRIEAVCTRLFIRSPEVALFVLRMASKASSASWDWRRADGNCLLGCAEARMAADVLQLARVRGWSKPQPGEEPAPRRTRSAA